MALRHLVVQTRRLLRERNGSKSRVAGQLDYCVTAQVLLGLSPQGLPRGNACGDNPRKTCAVMQ